MTPDRWQRIEELYLAALQLEASPRAAFLAEACAGDAALEHEVASLLTAHDEAGEFLMAPAAAVYALEKRDSARAELVTQNDARPAEHFLLPSPPRPRAFWIGLAAWLLLVVFFMFTCVLAFQYGATDKFGYRVRLSGGQQIISEIHAQGPAGGRLQVGDRIVALDGDARFRRVEPFYRLQTLPDGQPYQLQVERAINGIPVELEFTLTCTSYLRPDAARWRMIWTHLLRALVCLVVAFFFLWLKPNERFSQIAFGGFLALSALEPRVLLFPLLDQLTGETRILMLLFWSVTGGYPIVPLGYHIAYLLPLGVFRPGRFWTVLQWLLYGCWIVAATRNFCMKLFGELPQRFDFLYHNAPYFAALKTFGEWYYALGLTAIAAVIIRNFRLTQDMGQRRRIKWVIAGSLAAAFAVAIMELARLLLVTLGHYEVTTGAEFKLLYWLADLLVIAFPVAWAYALLTRRIYDVSVVIRRSVQYLLAQNAMRVLLALPVLGLLYHVFTNPDRTIREAILSSTFFLLLAGVAALGLLFQRRLSAWVDRRFFRDAYQQEQLLLGLLDELRESDGLPQTARRISERLSATLHPQQLYFFFRDENSHEFRLRDSSGGCLPQISLNDNSPLLRRLEKVHAACEVETLDAKACPPAERRLLERLQIRLLVPLDRPEGKLVGLMLLGEKRSEEPYGATERRLLYAIAQQLALVWEIEELRERVGAEARVRRDVLNRLDGAHLNLLKECAACGKCYDAAVKDCAECQTELTLSLPIERTVAKRYQLVRVIGKGGMGTVYQAQDLRLRREVALKVLAPLLFGDSVALRRFEREARAAARLNHPNIVGVHDHGTTSAGGAWLAMELVQGVTLRKELQQRGAVAPAQAAEWFQQLLAGVAAAHDAGVIHRDLKPENILLNSTAPVRLQILDFGLARLRHAQYEASDKLRLTTTGLTADGLLLGTPNYMSPEQCNGEEIDERSDIFALGVLLAEILTGVRPFERATYPATLRAISCEPFHLPGSTDSKRPIQAALNAVLQRCLAKERQARFHNVGELEKVLLPALRAACEEVPLSPARE